MRILYTAMKHDYGDPTRGSSFEQNAFHDTLVGMGCEVMHYDAVAQAKALGARRSTIRLHEIVSAEQPDALFSVLFTDELDRRIFRGISDELDTPTVNWFCDDHWRFDDYSADWAPCFNHVVTTAASAVPKYHAMRGVHAIKSQWAANPFTYLRDPDAKPKYDISFVGLPHGNRQAIVDVLTRAGLNIDVFGLGWGHGRLDQPQMIDVFNHSRINLNLSNASTVTATGRSTNIEDDPLLHRLGPASRGPAATPRASTAATAGCSRRSTHPKRRTRWPPTTSTWAKPSRSKDATSKSPAAAASC